METVRYGRHSITTYLEAADDEEKVVMTYCGGHFETWYVQRGNRFYREEESTNVRSDANALRRISRAKFEEVRQSIVAAGK